MSKLKITETALRDGHQSLMATRLKTDEIIPILETMDKVGYHSMEVWGGATFDSCIRFLNEDPWERLRLIRKHVKNTKLQMLLRGQNLLGYRHYGDDTVERLENIRMQLLSLDSSDIREDIESVIDDARSKVKMFALTASIQCGTGNSSRCNKSKKEKIYLY